MTRILTLLVVALAVPAMAEPRLWKNQDASRSFRGEFISRNADKVTIHMLPTRKEVSVRPDQLHADDLKWLREHHPLPGEKPAAPRTDDANAIYDTVAFGDSRKTVMKKLMQSMLVENTLPDTFFDRTGLNGVFRTRKGQEFHGMHSHLYYGWDDSSKLKELSFHGEPRKRDEINAKLVPVWNQLIANLTKAYGEPGSTFPKLDVSALGDGEITFTHMWKLKPQGTLLLGAGREDDRYMLIVRYTTDKI